MKRFKLVSNLVFNKDFGVLDLAADGAVRVAHVSNGYKKEYLNGELQEEKIIKNKTLAEVLKEFESFSKEARIF